MAGLGRQPWRLLVAAAALWGCQEPPPGAPLRAVGSSLRDAAGRTVIVRGVGVQHPQLVDVSFDDGRAPRTVLPAFDDYDGDLIRRHGLNTVRLALSWSALEPAPGDDGRAYLDRVAAVVDLCRRHDLWVFLELHQEGYSKELCYSGAPRWAVAALPQPPLPGGPPPAGCETSAPALAAHAAFFADPALQAAYLAMLQRLALRFRDDAAVIGYGVLRAPEASDAQAQDFAARAAQALRQVDGQHLVVFQPPASRDRQDDAAPDELPALAAMGPGSFPVAGAVYGVRVISPRSGAWEERLDRSVRGAREEALSFAVPLLITEHAAESSLIGLRWLARALDNFDAVQASSLAWPWDPAVVQRDGDGALVPAARGQVLAALDRPYAPRIGGDLLELRWDALSPARLTVRFRQTAAPTLHELSWYSRRYGEPSFTCDGRTVVAQRDDASRALYVVPCGDSGAPGDVHELVALAPR